MAYLFLAENFLNPQNKLQKAIVDYFYSIDRTHFEDEELEDFQNIIETKMDELNRRHSKYKQQKFSYLQSSTGGDILITGINGRLIIKKIKNEIRNKEIEKI